MKPDRRTLLATGAVLALPAWMARAFSNQASGDVDSPSLDPALERARAIGKPLLVIFTDPAPAAQFPGKLWGQFFAHAQTETWLDLALVEVVCLPREALGKLGGEAAADNCWAVLFETDASAALAVAGDLPAEVTAFNDDAPVERAIRARTAALSGLLHAVILPDDEAAERRRAQSASSLAPRYPEEDYGRLEAAIGAYPVVRLGDLDRFAAIVRFSGTDERREQLARAARQRLFELDPPGARWGTFSDHCPPCGMGHLPPASRYFLEFYTR